MPTVTTSNSRKDGFSLSEAMDLWWNLENVEFSLSGTISDSNGSESFSGTISLNPFAALDDFSGTDLIQPTSAFINYSSAFWDGGVDPNDGARNPIDRVCVDNSGPVYVGNPVFFGRSTASSGTFWSSSILCYERSDRASYVIGLTISFSISKGSRTLSVSNSFTPTEYVSFLGRSWGYTPFYSSGYSGVSGSCGFSITPSFFTY